MDTRYFEPMLKYVSRTQVALYRATDGRIGGTFKDGQPICLLTTKGRKSGKLRTNALIYLPYGDSVVVVASKGGHPAHPLWYRNLVEEPRVLVRTGAHLRAMRARTADKDEREELWPRLVDLYREYDWYQAWTDREIPVVICEPI
ncbi:nitroreductase family deazaflavin-dependent oxidoreductase [Streptomyces sp. TRM66268-LWL]|uniref:Nitroreductase family deazaflavin-dependent oxidoreductase n=2 Tax=Streptomyces polyasparticus TaxID=2767826 RepID=A0ABR7SSQ3_9ACTN|nr:nitroreductase family deazaflavin-dependent oxidoreductase [Streptomyces polyasparticus]